MIQNLNIEGNPCGNEKGDQKIMANEPSLNKKSSLYNKIASILEESRKFVASTVHTAMVQTYFKIRQTVSDQFTLSYTFSCTQICFIG